MTSGNDKIIYIYFSLHVIFLFFTQVQFAILTLLHGSC